MVLKIVKTVWPGMLTYVAIGAPWVARADVV